MPARTLSMAGDTIAIIGTLDGADHEVFGRLIRAAAHEDHGLFLLDLQRSAVFWYGFDGSFRDALLSRGEGPGELDTPWDLHLEGNRLWLLDRGHARISGFELEDTGIAFVRSTPSGFRDGSLCRLGDRTFRAGLMGGHTLHEMNPDGTFSRSMGPAPTVASEEEFGLFAEVVASQILRGQAHCLDERGVVIVAAGAHPLVRAFREDGTLLWETELPEVHAIRFRMVNAGSLQSEVDPETGAHFLGSILPWTEGSLLLQYTVRFPTDESDDEAPPRVDSRLVDVETGEELARSTALPLLHARAGEYAVILEEAPYPRALVLELREVR